MHCAVCEHQAIFAGRHEGDTAPLPYCSTAHFELLCTVAPIGPKIRSKPRLEAQAEHRDEKSRREWLSAAVEKMKAQSDALRREDERFIEWIKTAPCPAGIPDMRQPADYIEFYSRTFEHFGRGRTTDIRGLTMMRRYFNNLTRLVRERHLSTNITQPPFIAPTILNIRIPVRIAAPVNILDTRWIAMLKYYQEHEKDYSGCIIPVSVLWETNPKPAAANNERRVGEHVNLLIAKRSERTLYYYEPHGDRLDAARSMFAIEDLINDAGILSDYMFATLESASGEFLEGMQDSEESAGGQCFFWCLLFSTVLLYTSHISPTTIVKTMRGQELMNRFVCFLWTIAIGHDAYVAAQQRAQQIKEHVRVCPSCGEVSPAEFKFCPECGTRLQPQ